MLAFENIPGWLGAFCILSKEALQIFGFPLLIFHAGPQK
jgi:hypothetical protein